MAWLSLDSAAAKHPVTGSGAAHQDILDLLDYFSGYCADRSWPMPVVTCWGRTRDDQERIYYKLMREKVVGGISPEADAALHRVARDKFSWHCVALPDYKFRAVDVRSKSYSPGQLVEITAALRVKFGEPLELIAELHGTGPHIHCAIRAPGGKPKNWV